MNPTEVALVGDAQLVLAARLEVVEPERGAPVPGGKPDACGAGVGGRPGQSVDGLTLAGRARLRCTLIARSKADFMKASTSANS